MAGSCAGALIVLAIGCTSTGIGPVGDPGRVTIELTHADFHSRIEAKILATVRGDEAGRLRVTMTSESGSTTVLADGPPPSRAYAHIATIDFTQVRRGDYLLKADVLDRDGALLGSVSERFTHSRDGAPQVGFGESNAVYKDGRPIFPVTTWMPTTGTESPKDTATLASTGRITTSEAGIGPGTSDDTAREFRAVLDAAGAGRVDAIGPGSVEAQDTDIGGLARSLAGHPALLAWMWVDEPEYKDIDPATVRSWTEQTHAADPDHPVVVNFAGSLLLDQGGQATAARRFTRDLVEGGEPAVADWLSTDYYPLAFRRNFGMSTQEAFDNFARQLVVLRKWTHDLYPLKTFIEVASQPGLGSDDVPTPEQVWAETWIAVTNGVEAISWFPHDGEIDPQTPAVQSRATAWLAHFAPVLAQPDSRLVLLGEGSGGRIDFLAKEFEGRLYVFAVNRDTERQTPVTFTFDEVVPTSVDVYGEARHIVPDESGVSDSFEPYEVHVYVIELEG